MNLNDEEIEFIKKHIKNAEELLLEGNENKLLLELDSFTTDCMDIDESINSTGLKAEHIIDKIVYED